MRQRGDSNLTLAQAVTRQISPDGTTSESEAVSTLGAEIIQEYFELVIENNGTIVAPFVDAELIDLQNCLDSNSSRSTDCEDIISKVQVDVDVVLQCLGDVTSVECQAP